MSHRPLAGLTVVDLTRYLPGPLAAHTLASLGARVIKVEEPELGDPVRWAPPRKAGLSALGAQLLSGVESLALDLKREGARQVLEELLAGADVLLETFRPGALARLGLAPEELRSRYSGMVICSLSGWGQDGPLARRSGHDLTYQAVAGSLASTAAVPSVPGADVLGASHTVTAVLAALVERQRTGKGCWIDAALYDSAVHGNLVAWAAEAGGEHAVGEAHDLAGGLAAYDLYPTADGGRVAIALLESHFWKRFVKALKRRDLSKLHLARGSEAKTRLAEIFIERRTEEWAEFFARHDLPAEVVLSAAEAARHPQNRARGVLRQGPEGLPRLSFPARLDGERPAAGDRVPDLGEDTARILGSLRAGLPAAGRRSGIGRRSGLRGLLARLLSKGS
ncbi:MAG: CoA transferase [Acidobacteria bacterium]|nr:CoA transferase [Acidobacteriota bacterium]